MLKVPPKAMLANMVLRVVLCNWLIATLVLGASAAQAGEPLRIVVLGDSLAAGMGLDQMEAFPALLQKDWVALETFDMKTRVEVDFTQNKEEVIGAINRLYFPGFHESNVFDALLETTDRLKDVKGKKAIVIIASGVDTFSKHNLDQTMKQLRQSDATIFCVGLSQFITTRSNMGSLRELDYLQAENQMKTFSRETGGYAWFPRFEGEMPDIFRAVAAFLRNQYSISYSPTNRARDGKFRKVKLELVAPDGSPLVVSDQKGKKQKYVVYSREGYSAPKGAD
jgi:VWFA-related protein